MSSKNFIFKGEVHDKLMGIAYRRGESPETILTWAVALMTVVDEEDIKGNYLVAVNKDGEPQVRINVFKS